MNILIVCSGNYGQISPFVRDQAESLKKNGVSINYYLIEGEGALGYLKNILKLKKRIDLLKPDLIHAHYGLSGLLATLQKMRKVIVTFHGSDINDRIIRNLSKIAYHRASCSIFVSKELSDKINAVNSYVIPCGVNIEVFLPVSKNQAREKTGLCINRKYILFSSSFSRPVKNYSLAKDALSIINNDSIELIELKGYSRGEVNILMNACDIALLTSFSEGSPQFVKEAMACNRPIVSTDVGDVRWLCGNLDGHYITSLDPQNVADALRRGLEYSEKHGRTNGRARIIELGLDSESTSKKIRSVYESVLYEKRKVK